MISSFATRPWIPAFAGMTDRGNRLPQPLDPGFRWGDGSEVISRPPLAIWAPDFARVTKMISSFAARPWIPAFAGMTEGGASRTGRGPI